MRVGDEDVLQLGTPALRERSQPVADVDAPGFAERVQRLFLTLAAFRAAHGFGRAIAAPQIGFAERFIAVDLGDCPFVVINPDITWRSVETFSLWDDCMSFPDLLVKVRRHRSVSLAYLDGQGRRHTWLKLPPAASELMQHEIDHLDGVLAVDRASAKDDIVKRTDFERRLDFFARQVDGLPSMSSAEVVRGVSEPPTEPTEYGLPEH